MDITKIVIELQQTMLDMQIKVANLEKLCDNQSEEIAKLKETGYGTGIYLDGVPEYYRNELQKELDSGKR